MATLATSIPSVAPITSPIAQHHHSGISFHQDILRSPTLRVPHNNAPCCRWRHKNLINGHGPRHIGGALPDPGAARELTHRRGGAR